MIFLSFCLLFLLVFSSKCNRILDLLGPKAFLLDMLYNSFVLVYVYNLPPTLGNTFIMIVRKVSFLRTGCPSASLPAPTSSPEMQAKRECSMPTSIILYPLFPPLHCVMNAHRKCFQEFSRFHQLIKVIILVLLCAILI